MLLAIARVAFVLSKGGGTLTLLTGAGTLRVMISASIKDDLTT